MSVFRPLSVLLQAVSIIPATPVQQEAQKNEKTVVLNPEQALVFASKAQQAFLADWNFKEAEQHFIKALSLNPNAANTHYQYARLLLAMNRKDEAVQQVKAAQRLGPQPYSLTEVAWIYTMAGDYSAAKAELAKLKAIDANSLDYHLSAQMISEVTKDDAQALAHNIKALLLFGYSYDDIQQAIIASGHRGTKGLNRWLADDKQEQGNIGQYDLPLSMARYLSKAKKVEQALDWLEKAYDARQVEVLWINVDPIYDVLRQHPRFIAVVEQIGLN
jgi:adenylate cyclase